MSPIVRTILLIVYYPLLIALLLSYLAPYANPKDFWPFAFLGLAYPWLLIINILFLVGWILMWKRHYWLSLFVILAGWSNMKNLVSLGNNDQKIEGYKYKILSFNVRNFDLYNWSHNKSTRDHIFEMLTDESPDILCLQEYFHGDSGRFETQSKLEQIMKTNSPHIEYTQTRRGTDHWGIATFTSLPIVGKGRVPFQYHSNNICMYTDVKMKDDTIRIYNMHLQSVSLADKDYKFIDALKSGDDTLKVDHLEEGSISILRRMKRAYVKRTTQIEKILKHIDECHYPVIICGDFNDTPFSYTYRSFSSKFRDAFQHSGSGVGATYIGFLPSYRIDFIFHSDSLTSSGFRVLPYELSDHYPISCLIGRASETKKEL